jgi:hypothetical protein
MLFLGKRFDHLFIPFSGGVSNVRETREILPLKLITIKMLAEKLAQSARGLVAPLPT